MEAGWLGPVALWAPRRTEPLQEAQKTEARMSSPRDYDVIVKQDANRIESVFDASGHLDIRLGWFDTIARMIMDHDDRGGVKDERSLNDFAGIDRRMVDGPFVLHLVGKQHIATVEEKSSKLLDLFVSHRRPEIDEELVPIGDHRLFPDLLACQMASDAANCP